MGSYPDWFRVVRSRVGALLPAPVRSRVGRWLDERRDALLRLAAPVLYVELLRRRTWWRVRPPRTFTGKVRYKIANDRRPVLVTTSDKVAVRAHIAELVGPQVLPELHLVTSTPADLATADLPRNVVVKASHASGGICIVWEGAPRGRPLDRSATGFSRHLVHPDELVRADLVTVATRWLGRTFKPGPLGEWPYRQVPPALVVEELLLTADGQLPSDHKFHVFDGVCRFVVVDSGRHGDHRRDVLSPAWEPLPFGFVHPPSDLPPPTPPNLGEMLELAERLAAGNDYLRVDLYDLGSRVVVGELTNFPAGGRQPVRPRSADAEVGRYWRLPRSYTRDPSARDVPARDVPARDVATRGRP